MMVRGEEEAAVLGVEEVGEQSIEQLLGEAQLIYAETQWLQLENRYLEAAERTLRAGWHGLEQHPQSHVTLLAALEELLSPVELVILRGERLEIDNWAQQLGRLYAPRRWILAIGADEENLPPALLAKSAPAATGAAGDGAAVAYICQGSVCSAPIHSFSELTASLRVPKDAAS